MSFQPVGYLMKVWKSDLLMNSHTVGEKKNVSVSF